MRQMDSSMASEVHKHIQCSGVNFRYSTRSLFAAMEKEEDEKEDLEVAAESASEMFEMEDKEILCIKNPILLTRGARLRDLFHPSVSEMGIQLWREGATWDTLLQRADFNATADLACQHP